jgi:hypothetical protein
VTDVQLDRTVQSAEYDTVASCVTRNALETAKLGLGPYNVIMTMNSEPEIVV